MKAQHKFFAGFFALVFFFLVGNTANATTRWSGLHNITKLGVYDGLIVVVIDSAANGCAGTAYAFNTDIAPKLSVVAAALLAGKRLDIAYDDAGCVPDGWTPATAVTLYP